MGRYIVTRKISFIKRLAVCPVTGDPNKPGWYICVTHDLNFSVTVEQYAELGSPVVGDFIKYTIEKVQGSEQKMNGEANK